MSNLEEVATLPCHLSQVTKQKSPNQHSQCFGVAQSKSARENPVVSQLPQAW
jgi:hypothetical protein